MNTYVYNYTFSYPQAQLLRLSTKRPHWEFKWFKTKTNIMKH